MPFRTFYTFRVKSNKKEYMYTNTICAPSYSSALGKLYRQANDLDFRIKYRYLVCIERKYFEEK